MTDTRLDKIFYELQGIKADTIRIIELLSERSEEIFKEELKEEPKETNVQETIQGIVRIVSEKAVQIVVGIRATWIPKSAIKNLDSIVLEQGKPVSVNLQTWFVSKVEWKVL